MKKLAVLSVALLGTGLALAHPHFNKRAVALLPGLIEASIAYRTVPVNELLIEKVAVGSFVTPRSPRLTLTGELMAGSTAVPSGTYTLGVIRRGPADWEMVLYPGRLLRGEEPAREKLIRLESEFSNAEKNVEHVRIDIIPGQGKFKGKAVVTMQFGTMLLQGALTYPDVPSPRPDMTPNSDRGHP